MNTVCLVERVGSEIHAACVSTVCLIESVRSLILMACVSTVCMFDRKCLLRY